MTTLALATYNVLPNPDALRVGQELRIPPASYVPPPSEPETAELTAIPVGAPLPPG